MALAAGTPRSPSASNADAIRVMVVDDAVVVRGLIGRWVEEDPELVLAGSARDGRQAVADIVRLDPDVVILDIEMPEMDGLAALPLLLKAKPGLVVIMASTLTRRNAEISLKALSLGARDYVPKPESNSGVTTSADFKREVVDKIKALGARAARRRASGLAGAPVGTSAAPVPSASGAVSRPAVHTGTAPHPLTPGVDHAKFSTRAFSSVVPRILAIGSSTGGPQALIEVVKGIAPIYRRVPVVITQHMPPTFTSILAEHLTRASGIEAHEAKDGESVVANRIYVAPGGLHMVLTGNSSDPKVKLMDTAPVNFCKPAVDPMFDSVAQIYGSASLAVVLTGMGSDGAKGAGNIASQGGSVIAQDEATSVVWGMPGATAHAGVCSAVLPLNAIPTKIVQLFSGAR